MSKKILFLLIFFQVLSVYAFEIKSEVSSEKEIKKRVHIKTDNLNLSVISLNTEEKEYYAASFTTPWFGFGKLKSRGLFTESLNPCGYSPTSEVFFQQSDLALDTSITDTGKYGMFVKPGEHLMFFAYGDEDNWYVRGIKSEFNIGDLSLVMMFENSDAEENDTEIFNAFFNLMYEKECFFFSSCTGSCFGSYTENGVFNREYLTLFYKNYFELNLMFSGTSDNYQSPGGKPPSSQYKYGVDAWVRPFRPIKVSCVYYNDYKRPDLNDELYNDFIQHLHTTLTLYLWNFKLTGGYTWENNFKNTSEKVKEEQFDSGIRFNYGSFYISLSNIYYMKDSHHYRDVWNATARFYFDPIQLSFTFKRDIEEEITDTFKEEVMLRTYPVFIKFTHKKEGDKESEFIVGATINY